MGILFAAGFVGRPLGGDFFVTSLLVIPVSLVVFYKLKRHVLVFPGRGGNLLLESASPSKREVQPVLELNRPGEICFVPLSANEAYASISDRN